MIEIKSRFRNPASAMSATSRPVHAATTRRYARRILIAAALAFAVSLGAYAHTGGLTAFAPSTICGQFGRFYPTWWVGPPGPPAEQMYRGLSGAAPVYRSRITA